MDVKRNARIAATGMYAPQQVLSNQYFDELLGGNVSAWLEKNLTIRERHWCAEDESTADLVVAAAQATLDQSTIAATDLDLVIVATDTPEYISPATASAVQYRLGATRAGAFDLNAACAGFVTGLDMGAKYIQADSRYLNVLVVGAYAMSKYLDSADKRTVTMFADGAGAVLLQATEAGDGWLASRLHAEGQYHDWMGIYGGGTHLPVSEAVLAHKDHLLKFVKNFPKEINPKTWTRMVRGVVQDAGRQPRDIDMIFFTQININSIRQTMESLGLPMSRTHCVMDRYGYTGSACIPMCLAEADAQGKLKRGDLVVFMGSGAGLAFAAAAFTW